MFNLEEFENNLILEKVDKLNKYLSKNKTDKISKVVDELEGLLDQQELAVPITYIFSILSENRIKLISEELLQKIGVFLQSENAKLKINSLIIIGFAMLANSKYLDKYIQEFLKFLKDGSKDIRNNVHYFLPELAKKKAFLVNSEIDIILESLIIEENKDNVISLLNSLDYCEDLSFDQLYHFRNISKTLLTSFEDKRTSIIFVKLINLIKNYFPSLKEFDLENQEVNNIVNLLENQFLMKRHNFTVLSKNSSLTLKEYLKKFTKSKFRDKKVYFYVKTKENFIYIYELEKIKLKRFFEEERKISNKKIRTTFSQIIDNNSELKLFIKTLDKLKIIDGYYSNIGFFYPYIYIKSKFLEELQLTGSINLKSYNFLKPKFINRIIKDISNLTNQQFLRDKNQEKYFSLKKFQDQINLEAAKNSTIDLKSFREILMEEDFIKLIKNLPKEFLSDFHKGTQWLTNLGRQKITNEIQNSKIVGFLDIIKISEKLNIGQLLLIDVFDQFLDYRSGIWNKKKDIFYYSKFLKDKINEITLIPDDKEKFDQIDKISKEFNIDKNHIISKIDENLQLIAEEIKQKEKIKIGEYLEKTGMDVN
ncbi:MAG: hypothetical protein ACFFDN_51410, partial [Candidatus Hodarchaeota archaeon]